MTARRVLRPGALTLIALALMAAVSPLPADAYISTAPGKGWYWQNPTPQGNQLLSTSFIDDANGWAVGALGTVLRTDTGGRIWEPVTVGAGQTPLRAVHFFDAQRGWIVGDNGLIVATTNGGATWTTQTSGTANALYGVHFASALTGWAVGAAGTIRTTTNGGATWTAQTSGTANALNGVHFASALTGWAVGAAGTIRTTTNGGATWTAQTSNTTAILYAVEALDAGTAWAVGAAGTVRRTTDGGVTWQTVSLGTAIATLHDVDFDPAGFGVIAGNSAAGVGALWATVDGGSAWALTQSGTPDLRGVAVTSPSTATIVGDAGTVVRSESGGVSWTELSRGTRSDVYATVFADALTGWAVGDGGSVRSTIDGGVRWVSRTSGTTNALYGADFLTASTGWVAGANGTIRRTVDGGITWTAQTSGTTEQLNDIDFVSSTHGWALGTRSTVLRTTNGGASWTSSSWTPRRTLRAIHFRDQSIGWLVGDAGWVYRTTDGGVNWTSQTSGTGSILYDVTFVDANTGWLVGAGGTIRKSVNGGTSWTAQASGTTVTLRSVWALDSSRAWAAGDNGTLVQTTNGGTTWLPVPTGAHAILYDVTMVNGSAGWLAGEDGTILSTTSSALPETFITLNPPVPDGVNGWFKTAPTVTLQSTMPGITKMSAVSSAGPWRTYVEPFIATQGDLTRYYYSINAAGNAEAVKSIRLKVDSNAPSTPGTVTGAAPDSESIDLAWGPSTDEASGVDRYEVFMNGAFAFSTTQTTGTMSGLMSNTLYSFAVEAVDAAGNRSERTAPTLIRTLAVGISSVTTVVNAYPAEPNGANGWYTVIPTMTLSWQSPDPEPSVVRTYYSWASANGPWSVYAGETLTTVEGTTTLHVSSHDIVPGLRDPETTRTVTFKVDTGPPSAPIGVGGIPFELDGAFMFWGPSTDDVSGVSHYNLYLDDVLAASSETTVGIITGITPNVPHNVYITAVDRAGNESGYSVRIEGYTMESYPPDPPTRVVVRATGGRDIYVAWEATATAGLIEPVSYHVWRSEEGGPFVHLAQLPGRHDTSFVDSTNRSSTRYTYAVSVQDYRGMGSLSTTSTTSVNSVVAPPPMAPRGLVSTESTGGAVTLAWSPSPVPNVQGYLVLRSSESGGWPAMLTTAGPVPGLSFTDDTGVPYQRYWYSVVSVDTSGVVGPRSIEARARSRVTGGSTTAHGSIGRPGDDRCSLCHMPHGSASDRSLLVSETTRALCQTCHDGTGATTAVVRDLPPGDAGSSHGLGSVTSTDTATTCSSCHDPHRNGTGGDLGKLLDAGGERSGTAFCYECHGEGSTLPGGDLRIFETSGHSGSIGAESGTAGIVCLECHETHGSESSYLLRYGTVSGCLRCHSAESPSPGAPDVLTKFVMSADPGSRHDVFEEDQAAAGTRIVCQNCHNTHMATSEFPLVDPRNPGPGGEWTLGSGDIDDFCFRCHGVSGLPTAADTLPWVQPPLGPQGATTVNDIETAWQTNVHGRGVSSSAQLRPDMGYLRDSVLGCGACHDQHGAANNYDLRGFVRSANGLRTQAGLIVYDIPEADGGGHDLRFFCVGCHDLTQTGQCAVDRSTFPIDCTRCHTHAVDPETGFGGKL